MNTSVSRNKAKLIDFHHEDHDPDMTSWVLTEHCLHSMQSLKLQVLELICKTNESSAKRPINQQTDHVIKRLSFGKKKCTKF